MGRQRDNKQIILNYLKTQIDERNVGVTVTGLCRATGLSRAGYYKIMRTDAEFNAAVSEMWDHVDGVGVDFAQNKLAENIKAGKTSAIIFYLKCRGGWRENNRLEVKMVNDWDEIVAEAFGAVQTDKS